MKIVFQIFDSKIAPILLYWSEIWGYAVRDNIEKVQSFYYKKFLGVSNYVSSNAVLGEVGRTNMCINYYSRCVKYWCRLLHMEPHRYPKACYEMLKSYDDNGKVNWVSHVRLLLMQTGFSYVWIQDCGHVNYFIRCFKQRCKDIQFQNWHNRLNSSTLLKYQSAFKSLLEPEMYILELTPQKDLIRFLCKFRCLSHKLKIQQRRYYEDVDEKLIKCSKCSYDVVEDEYHFLLVCPYYTESRKHFISSYYYKYPTKEKFNMLLATKDVQQLRNIALYLKRNLPV